MADDILRIGAEFDVAPVIAGTRKVVESFDQTVSAAQQMAQRMAAAGLSFTEASSAMKNLGFTGVETSKALAGVGLGAKEASSSLSQVAAASEEAAYSMTEARFAAAGLSEELGTHLPRVATSFIAHSQLIGPVLAAAFTPIAIIALAEVLVSAGKKMYDLYQNVYNLKEVFDELAESEKKLVPVQVDLSNSLTKLQAGYVKLTEGGVAGATAQIRASKDEIVNLQSQFGDTIKALGKISEGTAKEFEKNLIFPAGKAKDMVRDVSTELEHLKHAQAQLADNPQAEIFGKGTAETVSAKVEAYTSLLDTLILKQAELDQKTKNTTASLAKELETFSKSGFAAAQKTLAAEFKPPDISAMAKQLSGGQALGADELDALKQIPPTASEVYGKLATDAVAAYKEIQKAAEENLKNSKTMTEAALKSSEERFQAEYKAGVITATQLAQLDQQALDKKYTEERAALERRLNSLGPAEVDARRRIDDELRQLDQRYANTSQQIWQKLSDKQVEDIRKALTEIGNLFNKGFEEWLTGHKKFGAAMIQVWDQMVAHAAANVLKLGEQELIALATHKTAAASEILIDAKKGAAGAYSAMADIPIVGPELGAVAAAATFAAIMAFGSFEHGGIIPGSTNQAVPIIGHGQEMVLPAHISTPLQNMIAAGGLAPGASISRPSGSSTTNHTHNHFRIEMHASGIDDVRSVLDNELVPRIQKAIRRGSLS